jgi:hypothetical protein
VGTGWLAVPLPVGATEHATEPVVQRAAGVLGRVGVLGREAQDHLPAWRRLGRRHQPPAERLGRLRRGLGCHQLVHAPELLQHLLAAARLEAPSGSWLCWVNAWTSRATDASSSSWLGGSAADRNDAVVPLASSIGPPGSAGEAATPATSGARRVRVRSSSLKSCLDVVATSWQRNTSLGEGRSSPRPSGRFILLR